MINESVAHVLAEMGLINEVFVVGRTKPSEILYLLAYRDKVWVFGRGQTGSKMPKKTVQDIAKSTGIGMDYEDSIRDPYSWNDFTEERPDILAAEVDGDTLVSMRSSTGNVVEQPRYHVQMNKVARALGLKYMTKSDREEYVEPQRRQKLPDEMMHGTDWNSCMQILRTGLMPSPDKTRYTGVVHKTHVFLTTHLDKAAYHSANAAHQAGSFPIIVKFKIPDKRLLDPDYDLDTSAEQKHYQDVRDRAYDRNPSGVPNPTIKQKSMGLSRDAGVMGYAGRIPASHITGLLIPLYWSEGYIEETGADNYREVTLQQAKEVADLWQQFDLGEIFDAQGGEGETLNPLANAFDPVWMDEFRQEMDERDEDED